MQDRDSKDGLRARWRWPLAVVVAGLVAALALSACGSSSSSSSSSATTSSSGGSSSSGGAKTPTGSPIKAMTIASVNTQGPPFPAIPETAKLYEQWINAHGGIKGHPLQVINCDDRGVAPQATACARQAVSQGVVAVVGSYTFMAEAVVPVLAKSNIAWFGTCCPGTPSELTSKDSFPVGSGPLYSTGFTKKAIDDGCKKINAVVIDGAQPYIPLMEGAMKAAGKSFFKKPIILPATSQDYSPQVAQATSGGADCVLMVVSEGPYKAWMGPWAQSGTKARMYGPQGNLDKVSIQGNEQAAEGSVIAGSYPDISTAPWADFRAAISQYNAPQNLDYNSLAGMGTWAGYTAFNKIVQSITGPVTAKSFFDAATKTTNLDLNGMVPKIDYTKEWTANQPYRRLFNRGVVFSTIKGGKVVPLTTTFEDVTNAALGKKG
jgi:ABC-type branched-subunit amino acid transport system substrate-binding protein